MSELKLKRGTFQHIEAELYAYHETKREILRIRNELISGKGSDDENIGGGRSGYISDPTGRTGILLASHDRLDEITKMINAIDSIYNALTPEKQKFVNVKYWTKPQTLNWEGVALQVGVTRATAFRWRDEIVKAIALKVGWR